LNAMASESITRPTGWPRRWCAWRLTSLCLNGRSIRRAGDEAIARCLSDPEAETCGFSIAVSAIDREDARHDPRDNRAVDHEFERQHRPGRKESNHPVPVIIRNGGVAYSAEGIGRLNPTWDLR